MDILLVEDECVTRESARISLERHGYRVVAVDNGEKALEMTKAQRFDVILMDIKLPGLSGLEVIRLMRNAHDTATSPPAIAFTGFHRNELPELEGCGFAAHIGKPFDLDELIRTIRRISA